MHRRAIPTRIAKQARRWVLAGAVGGGLAMAEGLALPLAGVAAGVVGTPAVTLTARPSRVTVGQSVTCTAMVAPKTTTGYVRFASTSTTFSKVAGGCTAVPVTTTAGTATCKVACATQGTFTVCAEYNTSASSSGSHHGASPGVTVGVTAASTSGYHEVASGGGVFGFGTATFHGPEGGKTLNAPIGGMAAI